MVKHKRVCTGIIATENALISLIGYCSFFELLAAPGYIVLVLATLAAELALPS
jgi:hypothetical protein